MTTAIAAMLWERVDRPGHDLCRLFRTERGWRLDGHAVFDEGGLCSLAYAVECDESWITLTASVEGSIDLTDVELRVVFDKGAWWLNGQEQPTLAGLFDIDLGFTPATNLIAIRRLSPGTEPVISMAAYLPFPRQTMTPLEQRYRRLDEGRYLYESPAHDFSATLTVSAEGFVTDYPGLWRGRLFTA